LVIERVETDAFLIPEGVSFSALTKEGAKVNNVARGILALVLTPMSDAAFLPNT
jgi:hypothetical protein